MSKWVPIGPDCVFAPRDTNFLRLSRRNEFGRQGLVKSIAVDPTDSGTIYTAEAPTSGGNSAFRTTDNAQSWTPIVDGLQQSDPSNVNPSCIAVNPLTTSYVYLGTYSGRVYVSPSNGDTWNSTTYYDFGAGNSVSKLLVDPRTAANPSTTVIYAACNNGVWRSSDGGTTFTQILVGSLSDFAARFPTDGSQADFYAGIVAVGVFHAVDPTSSSSWKNLTTLPASKLPKSNFDSMRIDICRLTPRPYVWFFNTVSGNEITASIYTAPNSKASWISITLPANVPQPKYAGLYDSSFALAPNSPGDGSNDILLFGSIDLARSIDSGNSWTALSGGAFGDEYHADYHAFAFFPDPPQSGVVPLAYLGCDGGLGVSTRLVDPTATLPDTVSEENEQLQISNTAVVQNYSHGKQSSAIYTYDCDATIGALGYIGCQDTGINAGDSALLWRGIQDADVGQVAVTQGTDGVKIWTQLGGPFYMYLFTDQGGLGQAPWALVTLPGGRIVTGTSNFIVDPNGNCLAGVQPQDPTTSTTAAIAAGNQTVTPASMNFIEVGSILNVDGGTNAETVRVTATTATTFTANFTIAHAANVGIDRASDTSIAAAVSPGTQTVQPGSMANISFGSSLSIDGGAQQETVTVTAVTSTTFTANFTTSHAAGAAVSIITQFLVRVDQSANAVVLSQNFQTNSVNVIGVSPTDADIVAFGTSDQRLFTSSNATAASPTWTEATTSKPGGLTIASITINFENNIFVLLSNAINVGTTEFPNVTPLFVISAGKWTPIKVTNLPATTGFGKLVTDPVQPSVKYAGNGARVYRLTSESPTSTTTWSDISNGLPGQWIYALWAGNIGTAGAPTVLLRTAIPTRGVWELDVSPRATDSALALYMRDNFLDNGRLPAPPDGVPNPYAPSDSGRTVYHYQCADIKVDAQQQGVLPGGAVVTFFQTDPEGSTLPLSHVLFDQLKDNSDNLPSANLANVHVQVRNRGLSTANNVSVWVLFSNAGAGLPALNLSASSGNNFNFWSQFDGPTGQILPAMPSDSPWKPIGNPQILGPIDPSHPQVATWTWAVPTLGSGDPGHYCLAAFVHCSGSPINQTGFDVDVITPANKQIGQKNLHIGPPLPPVAGGSGGGPGSGGVPSGPGGASGAMREYIEFHNSSNSIRTSTLVFDLRGLPTELKVSFVLTPITTVNPLPGSITGVVSTTGEPGRLGPGCHHKSPCHHHESDHHDHDHDCHHEDCHHEKLDFCHLCQLLKCKFCWGCHPKPRCPCEDWYSKFKPIIYTALPSSLVSIAGVEIPAYGSVAAFFTVTNTGTLERGTRYWFNMQQFAGGVLVGGSTYVVKIWGNLVNPNESPQGDEEEGDDGDVGVAPPLPVWIQGRSETARQLLGWYKKP